jgi:cytochrome c oxidase assembly protein subunit 15
MSLDEFKAIYWWEWSHRLLGRLVGAAFALPLIWFAVRRQLPRRLIWRCAVLLVLGGLQGLVGWWMVASGLADRISVAPERLMVHLGLAFALLAALVWTGLEAWAGQARLTLPSPWTRRAALLIGLIYLQILLGALVAGNDAGLVYRDWPLMDGRVVPRDYGGDTLWGLVAHNQAAVQLHHRLVAYLLTVVALVMAVGAARSRYMQPGAKILGVTVGAGVLVQAALGVATLMLGVPLWLGVLHQFAAAVVLSLAVGGGRGGGPGGTGGGGGRGPPRGGGG